MNEHLNRDELEHLAMQEQEKQEREAEKEPYVERPKWHRVFAWILAVIMVIGVLLYYYWIARG